MINGTKSQRRWWIRCVSLRKNGNFFFDIGGKEIKTAKGSNFPGKRV